MTDRRRPAPLIVALLSVSVLVAAGIGLFLASRHHRPKRVFFGTVEARTVEVGSLVGGRVLAVRIEVGQAVEPAQELLRLESDLLDRQIAEQRARVAEAEATLAKNQRGPRRELIARARIDWEAAERERRRQRRLLGASATTREQYDEAVSKAASQRQAYLEALRGYRREEIRAAAAALDREQARLAYLEQKREELVIRSPIHGRVEVFDLRPGDILAANQAAVTLLERDQLWVRIYVPEPELGWVVLGQRARITVDTFPRHAFRGRVVEIRQQGEYTPRNLQTREQRSDLVFGVKVEVAGEGRLRPGMAATVDLVESGANAVRRDGG